MDSDLVNDCLYYSLSGKNIQEISKFILHKIIPITHCTFGFIGEKMAEDRVYFRYHAIVGNDKFKERDYVDSKQLDTLHNKVLNGESVTCRELSPYCNEHSIYNDLKNIVMYPLKIDNVTVGILGLSCEDDLTEDKLKLLKSISEAVLNIMIIAFDKRNTVVFKDKFLSNISHEIRTPLNSIISCISMLKDTSLTSEQKDLMTMISQSSMQLLDNANDILDYTKIISGYFKLVLKPMLFKKCVEDIVAIYKPKAAEKNLVLHLNYKNIIPDMVIGDTTRLTQILLNLMNNAIKFTKTGTIDLNIQSEVRENIYVISFQLIDTGKGINVMHIPYLFSTFQRNVNYLCSNSGLGLGLLITKQLVILHNGKIWIDSVVNQGTTVNFTLEYQFYHNSEEILQQYYKDINILILSNNVADCKLLYEELTCYGFHVIIAREINMYLQNKIRYIIVDETMKSLEILSKIKKCQAKSIILCTNDSHDYDYTLYKPLNTEKIKHMLDMFYNVRDTNSTSAKIIIAENTSVSQTILTDMLHKLGYYNIVITSDSFEFYMELVKNNYDIAFINLEMDGISVVKKYSKNVLLIAVTESISKNIREKCYAAGMNGYITKPINSEELHTILKTVLGTKT